MTVTLRVACTDNEARLLITAIKIAASNLNLNLNQDDLGSLTAIRHIFERQLAEPEIKTPQAQQGERQSE